MNYKESFEYELHHTSIGKQLLSEYDILEEIYQSANSRIFKLGTENDGEVFLLKVIKKHSEFDFSIDKAIKLNHKGISKIYDYLESELYLYIIKEYVEGQDLETYVKEHGRLDESLVKEITLMLTDILDYLHHYNGSTIIFRDLKPSNIIVTPDGSIKLIDIVTLREINESKDTDTFYVGSRGYSAPEQFGYMQSKPTSDVYSLGATMYFLITGDHPQVSMNYKEMDELSPRYARIVRRAMEFNPKDRYSSVKELVVDITTNKRARKRLTLAIGFVVALLIGIIAFNTIDWSNLFSKTVTESYDIITSESDLLSGKFDPKIYSTENDVDLTKLTELEQGFHFEYLDNRVLKVYLRREDMVEELKDFTYIYVFAGDRPVGEFEAKREIYNLVNTPDSLDTYLPVGYEVDFSKANHALILLFADDYEPIGYLYYNDIAFDEAVKAQMEVLGTVELSEGIRVDYYSDYAKLHIDASTAPEFSKYSLTTVEVSLKDEAIREQYRQYAEEERNAFSFFGEPFTFNWGSIGGFLDYDYALFLQNDDYEILEAYYIYNIDTEANDPTDTTNTSDNPDHNGSSETISGELSIAEGVSVTYVDNQAVFSFDENTLPNFDGIYIASISSSLKEESALAIISGLIESPDVIWEYDGGTLKTSVPESSNFLMNDWAIFIYEETELVGEYYIYNLN